MPTLSLRFPIGLFLVLAGCTPAPPGGARDSDPMAGEPPRLPTGVTLDPDGIGFRVKGDLNKPELEPRFKKIPVDEIERKLDEGRAGGKKRFEAIGKLQTLFQ